MNKETKKLNALNNALDKKVNKENDTVLTDIICYLRVADISEYHQEVVRHDLLEMVLSAQERNEDIQTVIGEDYKVFCDDVIASLNPKTFKEKAFELLDILFLCTSILGATTVVFSNETFELIQDFIKGESLNFQISISVFTMCSYFLIIIGAYVLVQFLFGKTLEQKKEPHRNRVKDFLLGAVGALVLLLLAWLGRTTLFTINIIVSILFIILFYLLHKVISSTY